MRNVRSILAALFAALLVYALFSMVILFYPFLIHKAAFVIGLFIMIASTIHVYWVVKHDDRDAMNVYVVVAVSVIVVIFTIAALLNRGDRVREADLKDQLIEQVEDFQEGISRIDGDGLPSQSDKMVEVNPTAEGMDRVLQEYMANFFNKTISQHNSYIAGLEEIGWFQFLDANRLSADQSFAESQRMIADARILLEEQIEALDAIARAARAEIHDLDLSDRTKKELVDSFDRGFSLAEDLTDRVWVIESSVVDEIEMITKFLAENPGVWESQASQLVFDAQENLDIYNSHMTNLSELSAEQQELREAAFEAQKKELEDL